MHALIDFKGLANDDTMCVGRGGCKGTTVDMKPGTSEGPWHAAKVCVLLYLQL